MTSTNLEHCRAWIDRARLSLVSVIVYSAVGGINVVAYDDNRINDNMLCIVDVDTPHSHKRFALQYTRARIVNKGGGGLDDLVAPTQKCVWLGYLLIYLFESKMCHRTSNICKNRITCIRSL